VKSEPRAKLTSWLSTARRRFVFATPHLREVSVNSTRVTHNVPLLGINPFDLSYAEWVSRRQMCSASYCVRAPIYAVSLLLKAMAMGLRRVSCRICRKSLQIGFANVCWRLRPP
jgi:hypothetical protein